MITENLKDVEARVCAACERSGRKREDVTLIAVSKTKPVDMLEEAYAYVAVILVKIKCRNWMKNMT